MDSSVKIYRSYCVYNSDGTFTFFDREDGSLVNIYIYTILNDQLKEQHWLAGNTFTIADIALYPWLRAWKWSKVDITPYPLVMSWIENVRERPGVGRGLAYGAPQGEIDQWSEERKAKYRKSGSIIANPDS